MTQFINEYLITIATSAIIATMFCTMAVLLVATRREYARALARKNHPTRKVANRAGRA